MLAEQAFEVHTNLTSINLVNEHINGMVGQGGVIDNHKFSAISAIFRGSPIPDVIL